MRVLSVICVLFLSPLVSAAAAKQVLPGPFAFELLEVIDGDTFRARVDIWLGQSVTVKVRLKGVDTPEMNGKCAAEKKLARQAKAFAENWL
ncbi:MAG: thermonuclease family protein, partial [Parvibaculales bacterium]